MVGSFAFFVKDLFPNLFLTISGVGSKTAIHGFEINDSTDPQYKAIQLIDEAVSFIKNNDPLRFRRLKKEISLIVILNLEAPMRPRYGRSMRCCCIALPSAHLSREWSQSILSVARTLVSISTLGHIATRGVLPVAKERPRIDWICANEVSRFLKKAGLCPENPENWGRRLPQESRWDQVSEAWGTCFKNSESENR